MGFLSKNNVSLSYVQRPTGILAQTGVRPLFAVTGQILITHLIGEVTTVIQAIANATKLVNTPLLGAATDLCATNDITGDALNSFYTITGTPANAMVNIASTPIFKLPTPITVQAGSIDMSCAGNATGSVKWTIMYQPLEPGATIYAI